MTLTRFRNGFTLVEMVCCIVVLAMLAGFAVPHYSVVDQRARMAAVQALAGELNKTAYRVHGLCTTTAARSGCSPSASAWNGTIDGQSYTLNYGWPDAGRELNRRQIDALVDHHGFHAYLAGAPVTRFVRDDAPTPDRCSVTYTGASSGPAHYRVALDMSGC